jgi:localization factor PodJL
MKDPSLPAEPATPEELYSEERERALDESQGEVPQTDQPVPQSREDFIAAARRAARQANKQPPREIPIVPALTEGSTAAVAATARAGRQVRPMWLIAACIGAVIVTGGVLLYGSSWRPMSFFAKSQSATPAAEDSAAKDKRGADASGVVPGGKLAGSLTFASASSTVAAAPAPADAPAPEMSARDPSTLGIMLQESSTPPSMERIEEMKRRQQIAAMSQHLTRQQAAETASGSSGSLPTTLVAAVAASPEGGAALPAPVTAATAPMLHLPPAMIGPSSLRMAAAKGDPSAQFEVAARFAEARGVKQDFQQALEWYQRAASQGFAPAQYRVATLYERGLGVEADESRALVWYRRAAEGGSVKAMHNLAVLSANRKHGAPDYATAVRWFTAAAERGLPDSQYNLAILTESGLGLERDPVAAYKWFSIAARNGDKDASRRRDALRAKLDPVQLRTAEREIKAWRSTPSDPKVNDARLAGDAWKTRSSSPG